MNQFERLQQAWQSQRCKPLDISPDHFLKMPRHLLLMTARIERWAHFVLDMIVVVLLLIPGTRMLWSIRNIQKDWPWIIYCACIAWVVGFMLLNHWRRRRHAPRYDEPMLAHVEWSIKEIEYRMWQDRHTFWWYILPLALGCMIPTAISIAMIGFPEVHDWPSLIVLLFTLLFALGVFAAIFAFVHWVIMSVQRMRPVVEARRRELEALRTLRETLLNPEEPKAPDSAPE